MQLTRIALATALAPALAIGGCAGPGAETATPSPAPTPADTPPEEPTIAPTPTSSPTPEETEAAFEDPQRCENDEIGFTVIYPGDWWANGRIEGRDGVQPIPACTYFAPEPVDLQPGTDDLVGIAIRFDLVDPVGRGGELIDRREVTVDGHDAVVIEREPDPTGFIPEGSTIYEYVIGLDGSELVATADDIYHDAYEANKEILDRMMQTIEIDG